MSGRKGRVVLALAGGCLIIGAGAFLADAEVRLALRHRVQRIDVALSGGWLRRTIKGQHLPTFPADMPAAAADAYNWLGSEPFLSIGHALGPQLVGGPNSLATLRAGLSMGFRVFEVDLALTAEDSLICYHGDDETNELATIRWADYLDRMAERGMAGCRFADLVKVAREVPNIWFVLDVKNRFDDSYRRAKALVADSALGRHFIPQIYDFDQLPAFRRDPFFAGVIFTSYRSSLTTGQLMAAALTSGVRAVTLTRERAAALTQWPDPALAVFTHPINDPFEANRLRWAGLRGIYSSYLTPSTHPELFVPLPGRRSEAPRPTAAPLSSRNPASYLATPDRGRKS